MAQRGQMGQIPVPMVLRRPGDPFAFNQPPFPNRSPQDQGRMGTNTRDFKIPGKEEYKVPKQFREEIMEALIEDVKMAVEGRSEVHHINILSRHMRTTSGMILPDTVYSKITQLLPRAGGTKC